MNEFLEDIILYIMNCKPKIIKTWACDKIPMNNFSPAYVLSSYDKSMYMNTVEDDFFFGDTTLDDVKDLNISDMSVVSDYCTEEGMKYQFTRLHLMTAKELRRYPFQGRKVLKTAIGYLGKDESFTTGYCYNVQCGNRWLVAQYDERVGVKYTDDHTEKVAVYLAVLFRMQYKWHVILGYENYPHLKFECTPEGAREVFRLRDIPEGKQRRTAIKHWVGEYYRKKPNNDEEYIKVLDYLRGQTEFTWNGMKCIIKPSINDLKRYSLLHNKAA